MGKKDNRFEKVYQQGITEVIQIFVDRQTGVNYMYCSQGYGGGLTPLLDRDGKPIITTVPKEYDA